MFFQYVLGEYKKRSITKFKDCTWKVKIMTLITGLLSLACIVSFVLSILLDWNVVLYASALLLLATSILIYFYFDYKKIESTEGWSNYNQEKIEKLRTSLKDNYSLLTSEGVELLISICNDKIDSHPLNAWSSKFAKVVVFALTPLIVAFPSVYEAIIMVNFTLAINLMVTTLHSIA